MKDGKISVGIIGTGGRGIQWFGLQAVKRDDIEIRAFCDPNIPRMEAAARYMGAKEGEIKMYQTVGAMLDAEHLDAVVVTSPDYCHEQNAVDALNKGVDVFIDKPLATTVKGCLNIISTAERNAKTAMIGFNLRHTPVHRKLKEIVDKGILGRVFYIENREYYNGGRTYMSRWNRKYEYSGGLWVHKGSHDFDVFNWLLGFPKPSRVSSFAGIDVFVPENIPFELRDGVAPGPVCGECPYADVCPDRYPSQYEIQGAQNLRNQKEMWDEKARAVDNYRKGICMYAPDKDVHDNGVAVVLYENGVKACHMECFVTSRTDRLYTVIGDRGMAEASLHDMRIKVYPRWSPGEVITYDIPPAQGGHGGGDPRLMDTFVDVVKGDKANTSTAEHGMWATAVGQAAEISRREGRTVDINELFE